MEDENMMTSCNFPTFITNDAGDLGIALALSKSLQETEQIQDVHGGQDKASKAPMYNFQEDQKELFQNYLLINHKLPTESYNATFKKRKMKNSTTLQLSNSEIKDRTLTKNLARILMEDESVEMENEIVSWACPSIIKPVVEQNKYLQNYRFVENNFWKFTTFWNKRIPSHLFEKEFMMKDVDEDKSSEFFRCFQNNREIESIHEQTNTNTIFSKSLSLENDEFPAVRQTDLKSGNSKSLKFYGEATIIKKRKFVYEDEANEDREYLNILSNLVDICLHNEDIHKFLKRLQLFVLETEKNEQIIFKNISDLEHKPNTQHEHQKFSDSEQMFCSSNNIFKENGIIFNKNVQEFALDNQVKSNKETGTIKLNLLQQKKVFSKSTKRADEVFVLTSMPLQLVEVEYGSTRPRNLRNGKTRNLFCEIVNANESQKLQSGIHHSVDIAAISDPIDSELLISCNNNTGFETLKNKSAAKYTFGIFSDDTQSNSLLRHTNSSIKQIIDHRFTDVCDKSHRTTTFTADCGYEGNILSQRNSDKLEICNTEITPMSTKCMDNVIPPGDYRIMQTSKLQGELRKYGLKTQKPRIAIQLLNHIRGVLQPVQSGSHEILPVNTTSCRNNTHTLGETYSYKVGRNKYLRNDLCLQDWKLTQKTKTQAETSQRDFKTVDFLNENKNRLSRNSILGIYLKSDAKLLKKIFKYQPLEINVIKLYIKDQDYRWNNNSIVAFLDEQEISFHN
ncbi:uncharacterized protein LOC117181461 isoform X2 [Belonocnema kinseyi]|uniref:uncharacterized protein LOC117181461 isoform X2 n=1 Tax=Belonocnema kinseyi TaxID=2817044 RepID=UPI00143D41A4|nr:uncharacterized protein LOC117181461 isoform X2 [Belonocnema kinseyi]